MFSGAKSNFTLVEMLVVIAIISILAGMLMPNLHKAVKIARQANCANNQKQIGMALIMYSNDWQGLLPPYNSGLSFAGAVNGKWYTNILSDTGYLPVQSSEWSTLAWPGKNQGSVHAGVWRCPEVDVSNLNWGGGYGALMIADNHLHSGGGQHRAWAFMFGKSARISAWRRPSSMLIIADVVNMTNGKTNFSINCRVCYNSMWIGEQTNIVASLHAGGANMLAGDGHVAYRSWEYYFLNEGDIFGHHNF